MGRRGPCIRTMRALFLLTCFALAAAAASPGAELLAAARKGQTDQVRALLKKRAPVNSQDKDGRTALMLAAEHGHAETVELLLDKGADPTARDARGWDAYAIALLSSAGGRAEVLKLLPQPQRKRLALEPVFSAESLFSSCSMSLPELAKFVAGLRVERMVAQAIHDASVAPGAGPVELVSQGVEAADAVVHLRIRPQVSCVQQDPSDNLSLAIDVTVTSQTASGPLVEKTFGAGIKGLHTRSAENPAQYAPLFAEWAKSHGAPIYWAVVGALLRKP